MLDFSVGPASVGLDPSPDSEDSSTTLVFSSGNNGSRGCSTHLGESYHKGSSKEYNYPQTSEDVYDSLIKDINRSRVIEQKELCVLFEDIEQLITKAYDTLIENTDFVEEQVANILMEVMASLTYNRSIYRFSFKKKEEPTDKNKNSEEPPETYPDTSNWFGSNDLNFICNGYHILKTIAYRDEKCKEIAKKIIPVCNLSRAVIEQFVEYFLDVVKDYDKKSNDLLSLKQVIDCTNDKRSLSCLVNEASELELDIRDIEYSVRSDDRVLYGTYKYSKYCMGETRKIRDLITGAYSRLVLGIAKEMAVTDSQTLENFQAGAMGLMKAVSYYDHKGGSRFSSYARWWIQQQVLLRLKENANFVHLPIGVWQSWSWLEKKKNKMQSRGINVTDTVLAEKSGYTEDQIKSIYDNVRVSHVYSLDMPLSNSKEDEEEVNLMQLTADSHIPQPGEISEEDNNKRLVISLLKTLSFEERKTICMNFGLVEHLVSDLCPEEVKREQLRQLVAYQMVDSN